MQQRCGLVTGTQESVIKMVSQTRRISVTQIQLVEHRWSLVSQMQLQSLSQTHPVRLRCHQPGMGSQPASCGHADRSPVLVSQTPMKSVFSQTQPDRLGLSGSDGVCGQSDMVVGQTQPVSHS